MDPWGDSPLPRHPDHPGWHQGRYEGGPRGDPEAEGQEPGDGHCAGGKKQLWFIIF